MPMRINLHERKQGEARGLAFLSDDLKKDLELVLPSLYFADGLAVFKGNAELDPDLAWDIDGMSWTDVAEAKVHENYLMVALKDNPGADKVKDIMQDEYKKAVLDEPLELVAYLDVASIREAFAHQIVAKTTDKPWELGYYMGDINDMGDVPGVIDNSYTDDGTVSTMVGAFGFSVAEALHGKEIKDTQSPAEALKFVEELYKKYGDNPPADDEEE